MIPWIELRILRFCASAYAFPLTHSLSLRVWSLGALRPPALPRVRALPFFSLGKRTQGDRNAPPSVCIGCVGAWSAQECVVGPGVHHQGPWPVRLVLVEAELVRSGDELDGFH